MSVCLRRCASIGFGEAAMVFAQAWGPHASGALRVFDIKTLERDVSAATKREDYARLGVQGQPTLAGALADADLILSLVTADQALSAAREASACMKEGALYCDFNSVAPHTKRAAAQLVNAAGGHYADVAIMAPVPPSALDVPLLVSGEHAAEACSRLSAIGFKPRLVEGPVGRASTVKMLRSVMIKGVEALTAECFMAACAAGVAGDVLRSLDESSDRANSEKRADYALDRMMVHGVRRAAEMDEVAATLDLIGTGSAMTRAAAQWQRTIGELGLEPPSGLDGKAGAILDGLRNAA